MSSGLSMTSVNKIKELAARREYNLAVEILDSQKLEKSLNPQFLNVCGEIYENVGREKEARKLFVKAHSMAPEANRIIFSLIDLYLKCGYFKLADIYYEQYIKNDAGSPEELRAIKFIMARAKNKSPEELYSILYPYFRDNMDERWSFELFLISAYMGKEELEMFAADYMATYKNSPNIPIISEVLEGSKKPEEAFLKYAESEKQDDDPAEKDIRDDERVQLKKDHLRLNPDEAAAVITELVDDDSKDILTSDKLKGIFRKKDGKTSEDSEDKEDTDESPVDSADKKNDVSENDDTDPVTKGLKAFIVKKFKKTKETDTKEDSDEELDNSIDETSDLKHNEQSISGEQPEEISSENDKSNLQPESDDKDLYMNISDQTDLENDSLGDDCLQERPAEDEKVKSLQNSNKIVIKEAETDNKSDENIGIDLSTRDFVTYDFDDGFAPESETISELDDDSNFEANKKIFERLSDFSINIESKSVETEEDIVNDEVQYKCGQTLENNVTENTENVLAESELENLESIQEKTESAEPERITEELGTEELEGIPEKSEFEEPESITAEPGTEEFEGIPEESESETSGSNTAEFEYEDFEGIHEKSEYEEPESVIEEPEYKELENISAESDLEAILKAHEESEIMQEEVNTKQFSLDDRFFENDNQDSDTDSELTEKEYIDIRADSEEDGEIPIENIICESEDDFPEFKTDLFPMHNELQSDYQNKFDDIADEESKKIDEGLKEEDVKLQETKDYLASLGIKI